MNSQIAPVLRKVVFAGLFVIPFIPLFSSSELFFPFITTKAFAFRIIVEVIFAAWVILAISASEYRPKRGAILYALGAFLAVVGLATIFSVEPSKSFWSNFERMEGYVGLLHLGAVFLVMSSLFKEREWKWWWNTSLSVAGLMVFYCIFQLLGAFEIHQGGVRVDGTLGNAAYLAVYLLIHIFVAILFLFREKGRQLRYTYMALIAGLLLVLYYTATRGAILGLLGGLVVMALINVFNKENARVRKWSMWLLGALAVLVIGFVLLRGTAFVQESPVLARFANLSLASWRTEGRAFIWPMAVEGIKERPLLGWGQENFNYVFAEHYQAEMFRLEPWFDRAHNIFLDWGISAGLLGLGAYLALYVTLLLALWRSPKFSLAERSVLTGLLAAYFFNNLFVFDNLASYMLFIALLAYVHDKATEAESPSTTHERTSGNLRPMVLPASIVIVALLAVLYFVNVKPIITNTSLIDGLVAIQMKDGERAMDNLERAFASSRLGRPEVAEWISTSAPELLSDEDVSIERRNSYFDFGAAAVERMAAELAGDPRYQMMAGGYFLSTGFGDEALAYFDEAARLIPEKQTVHVYRAQAFTVKRDRASALAAFEHAYELAPGNEQVRRLYETARDSQ